ncbi:hypothetical protein CEXT_191551 [Caerostris extrusa]|uniref:Uncharacterized protein n=1 Tax=Caerostris extrusa TaxID=172846 RepID=A0AAV4U1P7_CAEEX|nr:hypothetical protein CEXT_191551 [Caerostris extrusa]
MLRHLLSLDKNTLNVYPRFKAKWPQHIMIYPAHIPAEARTICGQPSLNLQLQHPIRLDRHLIISTAKSVGVVCCKG